MNALPLSDIGGGAVKNVSAFDYELLENPYREQAGTPNIVGVIALANTLKLLNNIGFQRYQSTLEISLNTRLANY